MLKIFFLNDQTGEPPELQGNYDYVVMINDIVLDKGRIEDHNRLTGWQGLVRLLADTKCKKKSDDIKAEIFSRGIRKVGD